ncbi:MAG: GNAT family N-acetyltransferase [Parachlamydiales bacterium]|nr:GNAT family N-acetyltransferase [Parachlamydiales bacterium]
MIEGRHVNIRAVQEGDLKDLFLHVQKAISKDEFFEPFFESLSSLNEKFKKTFLWDENESYALILNFSNEIIGMISSKKISIYDALDIKYIIFDKKNRARGYMKESLLIFSNYLFQTRKINRLQLSIPNYHRASIAIAQKCGFAFEGIFKEALFSNGKYLDLCIYSKLRKDFNLVE